MLFSNEILTRVIIFVLGLCGFWVARHIYKHKKIGKPLVCPVGFDCNFVVHSEYSEFMHIPLEIFGMVYYLVIAVLYLYFIFVPEALSSFFSSLLFFASLCAFLFAKKSLSLSTSLRVIDPFLRTLLPFSVIWTIARSG